MHYVIQSIDEFYHIYNRGVDKRDIFNDSDDLGRFLESILAFNTSEPIGSLYEHSFGKKRVEEKEKNTPIVSFIAYCINPNHYHFILTPLAEKGIEQFMHRLGTGYTKYFNTKYRRSGSLFGGKFKASHVNTNEYLLHLSAYVNLNDKVHKHNDQLGSKASKLVRSSLSEYTGNKEWGGICNPSVVLKQFDSSKEYEKFALSSLEEIQQRKQEEREFNRMLFE